MELCRGACFQYGLHEAIISEEVWNAAQAKLIAQAKKYEHVNKGKDERTHLLSGIVRCPVCGAGMYGNKSIKYKKDGTKYKDFFFSLIGYSNGTFFSISPQREQRA